ncbi:hypothetical protein HY251_17180 [bacterium]|nr:hypothetical protein [bacterium]
MKRLAWTLLVFVVLPACAGHTQEGKGKPESPPKAEEKPEQPADPKKLGTNPFAQARTGDWAAFSVLSTVTRGQGSPPELVRVAQIYRVEEEGDAVHVTLEEKRGDQLDAKSPRTFSKKEPVEVYDYLKLVLGSSAERVTILADRGEKRRVGDRDLACRKVDWKNKDGAMAGSLWLCDEVRSTGLVALRMVVTEGEMKAEVAIDLVGHGGKDKTAWGKTPEEALKAFDEAR